MALFHNLGDGGSQEERRRLRRSLFRSGGAEGLREELDSECARERMVQLLPVVWADQGTFQPGLDPPGFREDQIAKPTMRKTMRSIKHTDYRSLITIR